MVGPRAAGEDLLGYARDVGELVAEAGRTVVSGGARGVDRAAMSGALGAGGRASGVLASDLARAATNRHNRDALLDGRLVLVSAYDPAARFLAGHAMERNHSVYGLADASLVVEALADRGGTRAGARAQLSRGSACPVYVRATLDCSEGLSALQASGALPWPDPQSPEALAEILDAVSAGDGAAVGARPLGTPPDATAAGESRALRKSSSGSETKAADRTASGSEQRLLSF